MLVLLLIACAASVPSLATPLSTVDTNQLNRAGGRIELPGMVIHGGSQKMIELEGKMALADGILEFGSVLPLGRDYESLLTIDAKPSAIHFALLLIGCEPGPLPRQAAAGEDTATQLSITVTWSREGRQESHPLEELLLQRATGRVPQNAKWYFTGSYFTKDLFGRGEVFMSDVEEAHIALWWTRAVIINIGGDYGNPYNDDQSGFAVNTQRVPASGTPVKVTIRKRGQTD